ncbi:MAG TPA: V-type ATP synthase subunit B, partial [Lentisphaeria bacterium]|nr:V-type ATP synthase subunit B [Lentisphaeria bacterium]
MKMPGLEYSGVKNIDGPLVFVDNIRNVAYDELVVITAPNGEERMGQVLDDLDELKGLVNQ